MFLDDDNPGTNSNGNTDNVKESDESSGVGSREKLRPLGQAGVCAKKPKTEDASLKRVVAMTEFMGVIANSLPPCKYSSLVPTEQEAVISNVLNKEVDPFKNEVTKTMSNTKEMISGMNSALQTLVGKLSGSPLA